jgi:hypothetical protein
MNESMNSAAATYQAIYDSILPAPAAMSTWTTERPDREAKSFALTRTAFDANRDELVKTIACIANSAKSTGYIVCRGGPIEDSLVDAAAVDDAVRSKVFPHLPLELTRHEIDGKVVDFITIDSRNRPHFMMNSGNELVVPFRGAANNITAGRDELDRIYEERQVLVLRRLLARAGAPDEDPVETFLAEVDWGGVSETQDQEFIFAIVPQDLEATPLAEFVSSKDAHTIVNNIWIQAMNVVGDSDWFARNAGIVTGYYDNYLEIYQPSKFQGHRIGTMFEGARRQAAEAMERVFSDLEFGRQMVVKKAASLSDASAPVPKKLMKSARFLVEMGGLEPPTPYMRSKCSTS